MFDFMTPQMERIVKATFVLLLFWSYWFGVCVPALQAAR
jgi:hypothetical protein